MGKRKVEIKIEMQASANKKKKEKRDSEEDRRGSKTLFVGNLSLSVEEDDVEIFFKEFGRIKVHLGVDSEGARTGFGVVEFATEENAQKALKRDGEDFLGHPLVLVLAKESDMSSL